MGWTKNAISSFCRVAAFSAIAIVVTSCSLIKQLESLDAASAPIPAAKLYPSASVPGAWIPTVSGAGLSNSKGTVTITHQTFSKPNTPMIRFQDTGWESSEVLVDLGTFDAANDFGYGSLTLTADALNALCHACKVDLFRNGNFTSPCEPLRN